MTQEPIIFPDNAPLDKYDYLIIHAFATPPSMTEVDALWVDRLHRRKGWSGCGYHAIITRSGELQHVPAGHRTRPYHRTGAHVGGCGAGWNERCIGISMAGGVKEDGRTPEDNFTPQQYITLERYVSAALAHFDIPMRNVIGHRDLIKMTNAAPKACPCFSVRTWIEGAVNDEYRSDYTPTPAAEKDRDRVLRVNKTYVVRKGDTLWGISNALGVPLKTLKKNNSSIDHDLIHEGQRLRIRH